MSRLLDWLWHLPLSKIGVVALFAVIGAALPKDLSARDRLMTFFRASRDPAGAAAQLLEVWRGSGRK